jgi:hypothetical protein
MRVFGRGGAVAASFVLLSSPPALQRWVGGDTRAYVLATIALLAVQVALLATWADKERAGADGAGSPGQAATWLVAVAAAGLVVWTGVAWTRQILAVPIDPYQGDMLVVVREGLRRLASGLNPYTEYRVPWSAPLPYGPVLVGPYALPMGLHLDLRFLSLAGELFVPVASAAAAIVFARRRRLAAAAGALLVLAAIGLNPDLRRFTIVAHTPVYWPLLALFAWLVARERWKTAAVCLGMLLAARSTMVAIVPVFAMAAWLRDRRAAPVACALVVLVGVALFAPFAIWDPRALAYALVGSYEKTIKEVVWPDATVPHTIGVTGVLLSHHWQRWVEPVQVAVLAAVYALAWTALRRGRAPVAMMGVALLAFSMTTLWPVTYIYFDVFLLLGAGLIAGAWPVVPLASAWTALAAADVAVVAALLWMLLPAATVTGAPAERALTPAASVVCVGRTTSAALVDVRLGADVAPGSRIAVSLNGMPLGAIGGTPGDLQSLAAPRGAWIVGANAIEFAGAGPGTIASVAVRRPGARPQ